MNRASALFERVCKSDSFGLLPSPAERISFASAPPRMLDLYLVPEDPADLTNCESCQ